MAPTIPFTLMRGGTSKGVFLHRDDVPADRNALTPLLSDLFGSPDVRQIDGLGGADKLTSKAAIMGPARGDDHDVTYLFAQVGIDNLQVDYLLNCGNLSAAAGLWAVHNGLVPATSDTVTVRILSENSDKLILAHIPCDNGVPLEEGDYAIAGVPGTGAPIGLNFAGMAGAITGSLLPFGENLTRLAVPDLDGEVIEVSVVDCANLVVFVRAEDVGLSARETPDELDAHPVAQPRIRAIRRAVAHELGIGAYFDETPAPASPICVMLAPGTDGDDAHLMARLYANGATSRAFAGTVTACTGVSARLVGSVTSQVLPAPQPDGDPLRIRHPGGVIDVHAAMAGDGTVRQAEIRRTARRIAQGRAYLKTTRKNVLA